MQVNETLSEGLKRGLTVTIPATELDTRLSERLDQLKDRVRIKGFRPGKVPVNHLRRVYGKAAMAEIVEALIGETIAAGDLRARRARRHAAEGRHDRGREGRDGGSGGPRRPFLHARIRGSADLRARRLQGPEDRAAGRRCRAGGDRAAADAGRRERAPLHSLSSAARRSGDRVSFEYAAKTDGKVFENEHDGDRDRLRPIHSRLRGCPGRAEGGRAEDDRAHVSGGLSGRASRGQAGDLRRHDQGSVGAGRACPRRRVRQAGGRRIARKAARDDRQADRERIRPRDAPAREAAAARPARHAALLPAAGEPRRAGVREHLAAGARTTSSTTENRSRRKAPPRRMRARNTAASPSGACGSGSSSPRSARPPKSP